MLKQTKIPPSKLPELISVLFEKIEIETLRKWDLNNLVTQIIKLFAVDEIEFKLYRETVLSEYKHEEYPQEILPVRTIEEIENKTMLAVYADITSEQFSRIKAVGFGKLYVKDGKIEAKGAWIIEVQEVEPPEREEERTRSLQDYFREFIIKLVIEVLVHLIARFIK